MIQHLGILIGCLFFHSKMVTMTYERLFDKCYIPLVEIKYFHALIDNKPFFDQPVKNKQETYENLSKCQEMMAIENLLDYLYLEKY